MGRIWKRGWIWALSLALMAGLAVTTAACRGATGPGAGGGPRELKELKFAGTPGGQAAIMLKIVRDQKIDEKHGLKIEQLEMPLADIQASVLSGKADVGYFNPIPFANLRLQGFDVVGYGPWVLNHGSWVVRPDSPYRSLADLRGKKVGFLARTTSIFTNSQMLAKMLGFDLDKDFQVANAEPVALLGLLERGELEMISTFVPVTERAVLEGKARILLEISDEWKKLKGTPIYSAFLGSKREWVEKNRDLARSLKDVFVEVGQIATKPETYRQYAETIGLKTEEEIQAVMKSMPRFMGMKWDKPTKDNLTEQIKLAVELGILEKMPQGDFFIDP